ncbi:hypothetical protein [Celeribacter indicus]|uniref:Uncharacterized protein n=1 Tax=Celeribacter indicus TaxID=1208324 RepID=A0A0B5DWG3_9RHOB|nr:hypothetical protein [Celeribacter indicus]AJE47728.1 hypothetical protein P73_3013 [Celeribacter indicus]SDW15402.1 hypothetical protein SAMN05443573_101577 [Celeribacter indicus]
MAERRSPLYLARASYRRRRLIDAHRLLPFVMFGLWLLPLLWGGEGTDQPLGAGVRSVLHVFAVWALGIVAAALIAARLTRGEGHAEEPSPGPEDGARGPSERRG